MAYTVNDWLESHAEVCVRLPNPDGSTFEAWMPVGLFTDRDSRGLWDYLNRRTWNGDEATHFRNLLEMWRKGEQPEEGEGE